MLSLIQSFPINYLFIGTALFIIFKFFIASFDFNVVTSVSDIRIDAKDIVNAFIENLDKETIDTIVTTAIDTVDKKKFANFKSNVANFVRLMDIDARDLYTELRSVRRELTETQQKRKQYERIIKQKDSYIEMLNSKVKFLLENVDPSIGSRYTCATCAEVFVSKAKLHNHLKKFDETDTPHAM